MTLPTEGPERIEVIDALRGLALFGILAANIRGFAGPAVTYMQPELLWPGLADRLAQAFVDTFIQGKFITLFGFLFGLGFAMQLERLATRVPRFGWYYARRMLLLVAIGLLHGLLIWWGDILVIYGFTGLVLLLFRRRRDRTIALWAGALYVLPMLLLTAAVAVSAATGWVIPGPPQPAPEQLQELVSVHAQGSWAEIQAQRAQAAVRYNWGFAPVVGMQVLALFLAGVLAWRRRLLQPSDTALTSYRRVVLWGLAIGVIGNVAATLLRWVFEIPLFPPRGSSLLVGLIQLVAIPALSLGYAATVVVLYRDPTWRPRLAPFAAVGRTALTNYLLQSLLGTLLFYSYGLGLMGRAGPAWLLAPTVALYALQVAASREWLRRYRFGPVEWLWRALAYRQRPPFVGA